MTISVLFSSLYIDEAKRKSIFRWPNRTNKLEKWRQNLFATFNENEAILRRDADADANADANANAATDADTEADDRVFPISGEIPSPPLPWERILFLYMVPTYFDVALEIIDTKYNLRVIKNGAGISELYNMIS